MTLELNLFFLDASTAETETKFAFLANRSTRATDQYNSFCARSPSFPDNRAMHARLIQNEIQNLFHGDLREFLAVYIYS